MRTIIWKAGGMEACSKLTLGSTRRAPAAVGLGAIAYGGLRHLGSAEGTPHSQGGVSICQTATGEMR